MVGERDGYGDDVVRRLREAGLADVGDASVCGTLRRLFQAGALTSYVVPSESGPHCPQPHGLSGRLWQGGAVPTPPHPS